MRRSVAASMGRKGGVLKQKKEAPKDFQKDKRKVGKAKKPAQNDTKTDYKVKQVQMPSQSMLVEKGDEVTHRKQGLLELLAHTQHHSAKVRRDAFHGLRELCDTHEGVLRGNLSRLFEATSTAGIDPHADVRVAFRTFQTWLLEALPQGAVVAFAPALALHVRSALSHVSSAVREDGLLLLELYLSKLGGGVLGPSETERVIETLCQLSSHADAVLSCLCRLLRPPAEAKADGATGSDQDGFSTPRTPQVSLHTILQNSGRGGDQPAPSSGSFGSGAPVWAFCLRAWQQAGAVPACVAPGGAAETAALKLCFAKLQCAATLEFSTELLGQQASSRGAALPSLSQLQELLAMKKRGEWPLQVEPTGKVQLMADSANVRLVRAVCLLASREPQLELPRGWVPVLGALLEACVDYVQRRAHVETGLDPSEDLFGFKILAENSGDVTAFGRASLVAHTLRCLDLLWLCAARHTAGLLGDMWSARATARLVEATVLFVADGDIGFGSPGKMWPVTGPLVLALPLVATLLGLPLDRLFPHVPASLRISWPHALAAEGSPCLAEALEQAAPGAVDMWVSACPRLLWALRDYEPALSEFVLGMLWELAKKAVQKRPSLHERLFSQACPYLLPLIVGCPDADLEHTPPPLVALPHSTQSMATSLLKFFPKISQKVAEKLTQVVCLWSAMGSKVYMNQGKYILDGQSSCTVLGVVLRAPALSVELRLRAALSVLSEVPKGAAELLTASPEQVALQLADQVSAWLMDSATIEGMELRDLRGSCLDKKRQIVLEELAWPLSRRMLAQSPLLAPRALCFLFRCVVRMSPCAPGAADADVTMWVGFLQEVYEAFVRSSPLLCRPMEADGDMVGIWAAVSGPLCCPTRCAADVTAQEEERLNALDDAGVCQRLAAMLVTIWMRSVPSPQRSRAYELLVRLCAAQLLSPPATAPMAAAPEERDAEMQDEGAAALASSSAGGVPGLDAAAADSHEERSASASPRCAAVFLAAGIRYRNESGLSTAEFGSDQRLRAGVTAKGLQDLREELTAMCARSPEGRDGSLFISLGAALPML